jgi:hypothetical protein
MKMDELKTTYVIFLTDVDPDTGFVSQMKPVAYTEDEGYAQMFTDYLNDNPDEDMPLRKYNHQKLF